MGIEIWVLTLAMWVVVEGRQTRRGKRGGEEEEKAEGKALPPCRELSRIPHHSDRACEHTDPSRNTSRNEPHLGDNFKATARPS